MASTAVSQGSLRQRNPGNKKKSGSPGPEDAQYDIVIDSNKKSTGAGSELDYKIALAVITVLAFISRFWGISHPNEVVFDEVHFGKVCSLSCLTAVRSAGLTILAVSSLPPTTSREPTFSTFTRPSASSSSPLWDG